MVKRERIGKGGYGNEGYFCSATCGWRFAVAAAETGFSFKPKKASPQDYVDDIEDGDK